MLTTFNFVDGVLPAGMGHLKTSPSWVQTQALADIELDKDASERIKKAAAEIYLHPQIKDGSGVSAVVRGKQLPKLVPSSNRSLRRWRRKRPLKSGAALECSLIWGLARR